MAWIESHQSLGTHRKLMRLCRELNISDAEAVGHLHYLWWWCLDNAPDGNLTDIPCEVLAEVAHWTTTGRGRKRDPKLFLSALITCQFVDNSTELSGIYLHDWDEYAGKLVDKRQLTKEQRQLGGRNRMAKLSESERKILAEKAINTRWHTSTHLVNIPATVPNSTVPNSTEENREDIDNFESLKKDGTVSLIFKTVEDNFQTLTDAVREQVNDAIEEYGEDKVVWALKKAIGQNHRSLAYASKILENDKAGGLKSNLPRSQPKYHPAPPEILEGLVN